MLVAVGVCDKHVCEGCAQRWKIRRVQTHFYQSSKFACFYNLFLVFKLLAMCTIQGREVMKVIQYVHEYLVCVHFA